MSFSGRTLTLYGCNPRFNPQHWAGRGVLTILWNQLEGDPLRIISVMVSYYV